MIDGDISVRVGMHEFEGWSQDQIKAFLAGVSEVVRAINPDVNPDVPKPGESTSA